MPLCLYQEAKHKKVVGRNKTISYLYTPVANDDDSLSFRNKLMWHARKLS